MFFPPNLGITSPFVINSSTSSPLFQEFPSLLPPWEQIHSQFSRAKMNGYYRISNVGPRRSRSIDFGELSSLNHTPRRFPANKLICLETTPNNSIAKKKKTIQDSIPEHDDEDDNGGKVFGIILGQISPAASHNKVMVEPQNSSFRTVSKKSLSFKRSASMSEGYSRIHHEIALTSTEDDQKSRAKKKKGGKFLKACRRFFGL